jgi:LysM repeat protein
MRPSLKQQALAGLTALLAVTATLVGGIILAFGDNPPEGQATGRNLPTATPYRIPTLPPTSTEAIPTRPTEGPPAVTVVTIPTSTSVARPTLPTPTTTQAAQPCYPHVGWVPYIVQPGDTLFQIGLRYGLTVDALMRGGCLASTQLTAGQLILVPDIQPSFSPTPSPLQSTPTVPPGSPTITLTATFEPFPTNTQTSTDGACTNPNSTITSPQVGEILSGVVRFYGTARARDFAFYKLEIRQEWASTPADFVTFYTGYQQVENGLLAELDTRLWPNGEYWIRLVVVDTTGNYPERCSNLYILNN